METRKIANLPTLPAFADNDEVIVRDVSATDPSLAVTKTTIGDLRAAIGGGSSDKIQDTAGTTRIETEEEAGRVVTTADGHQDSSVGKDGGWYESEVDAATGTRVRIERGNDLLGQGVPGYLVSVIRGGDILAATTMVAIPDGDGGVAALNLSMGASDDNMMSGAGNRGSFDVYLDFDEHAMRVQGIARTEEGGEALLEIEAKEEEGATKARLQAYDHAAGVTSGVRVDRDGVLAQAGSNIAHLLTPTGAQLPSGDDSLPDWIERVEGSIGVQSDQPTVWGAFTSPGGRNQHFRDDKWDELRVGDLALTSAWVGGPWYIYRCTGKGTKNSDNSTWIEQTLGRSATRHVAVAPIEGASATTWNELARWDQVGNWTHHSGQANAANKRLENLAAPTGDNHAARRVDITSRDPVAWTPSWSADANATGATHIEASVQAEGDYIDLAGCLSISAEGAGNTVVTAAISTSFAHPTSAFVFGTASASGSVGVPAQVVVTDSGVVAISLEAVDEEVYQVGFRVRYRKVGT